MYAEVTAGGPGKFHAGQVCGAVPEAAAIHFSGLVMESLRVAQEPIWLPAKYALVELELTFPGAVAKLMDVDEDSVEGRMLFEPEQVVKTPVVQALELKAVI